MLKSKTRWMVKKARQDQIDILAESIQVTPLVASLLVNRGLVEPEEAKAFLFTEQQEFHDPYLFEGMERAVNRIRRAIENEEPILIFGDYDCDGVTSTTVMMKTLLELGAHVQFYIPNRFTEGYGPNEGAFRHAHESGFRLIITVDTGIAALHEAAVAKELGVDLIITDHHEPGPELPIAEAIIHPKLANGTYPFHHLAGVGTAFKLAHALLGCVPEHLIEFAAIGTVADLVPLKGENRLIVQKGLQKLKSTENIGLKSLFKIAGIEQSAVNEESIGFSIAPRINAAGRLDSADHAVQLLLSDDPFEAETLAEEIEQLNKERKELVNAIAAEAVEMVEQKFPPAENRFLIVGNEGWNSGVIGIVASKLVEKFYRPTIVFSYDYEKGLAKGSARSILGFDLFENLSTCRDILPHFGGHTMAAGMTLKISDVEQLRSRLNKLAHEQLKDEDLIPVTTIDTEVSLSDIDLHSIEEMNKLAPYGMDNPKPKVMIHNVDFANLRKIGSEKNHLKITLEQDGSKLDGVGFGLGGLSDHISPAAKVSVIGELSVNEWNNIKKPQIYVQDLSVKEWQLFDCRGARNLQQLSQTLPQEQTKWIVFQQENVIPLQKKIANEQIIWISSVADAEETALDFCNVVLFDLPYRKDLLVSLLSGKETARIYAHFYKQESDFFSTMPTREHFKWYYALLLKRNPFDLKRYGNDLAKHRGWTRETVDFMSKVFFELDFVTINNGLISLNYHVPKRDLAESFSYQKKQSQIQLEKELLYSSYPQLKNWFEQVIYGAVKFEEEESKNGLKKVY